MFLKSFFIKKLGFLKGEFFAITSGNGNFKRMLFLWGAIPGIIISLILHRKIDRISFNFFKIFLSVIFVLYFSWHFYSLCKTIHLHPEYKKKKIKKRDLYKDKTDEEIKKIKIDNMKNTLKKALLMKSWDTTPDYFWVGAIDLYVILTFIQYLVK